MLESRFQVSMTINGVDYGIFDSKEGAGLEAELPTHQPGGADVKPIVFKNKKKPPEPITLARYYDKDRDHARLATIKSLVGNGDCVVTVQPLDADDNPIGDPETHRGVLSGWTPPNYDSNSDDVAKCELVITLSE